MRDNDVDNSIPPLTAAQQRLAASNMALVPYLINRYWPHLVRDRDGMDLLVSAGNLGLTRAARTYRESVEVAGAVRKIKFSTWACKLIYQHVCNELNRWSKGEFRGTQEFVAKPVSLSACGDTIPARPEGAEEAPQRDELAYLELHICALPDRERLVVREVFFGAATAREVGAQLGVTKERVRQIKEEALERLRGMYGNQSRATV